MRVNLNELRRSWLESSLSEQIVITLLDYKYVEVDRKYTLQMTSNINRVRVKTLGISFYAQEMENLTSLEVHSSSEQHKLLSLRTF